MILEYCTDATGLTLGDRTRLLTDAIGLLSHLDLSPDNDIQFSDSHLSLTMSFKTQLFLCDLDKNGLPKKDILSTFDEDLPFDLEPLAKNQYRAVKKKWNNMLKRRGSEVCSKHSIIILYYRRVWIAHAPVMIEKILAVKTRTLKALQERFPYSEFLQELKSFLGIIAGNVNRTFPPTKVIEMVHADMLFFFKKKADLFHGYV